MKYLRFIPSLSICTKSKLAFRWKFARLVICCALLFSCESLVEVELPNTQVAGETVFANTNTATAALTNIYSEIRENNLISGSVRISDLFGLYADELDLFATFRTDLLEFYNHTIVPRNITVSSIWNNSYGLIFASNSVIDGLKNSVAIPQEEKDQLIGEALFLRAFLHFYLVNLFGDIPYISTTDFQENTKASKMTVADAYQKIIIDLSEAKELLSDSYISLERTRPNRGTVSALLSRVYLYMEDWEKAEMESTSIINNTNLYVWENDLGKVFLRESTSTIWQFKPNAEGENTEEAPIFIFVTGPPPLIALTSSLINAFEPTDMRRNQWIGDVSDSDGTDTWYHAFKYKEQSNTPTSLEYTILFRLGEQYLIRAEARAQLGDITGAQEDLNAIRNRAGLGDTSAATTSDLLDAILQERQVELFTEFGHRWFDLKRTGRASEILAPLKPGWQDTDILLPIPETELLINPNLLPQNPGY